MAQACISDEALHRMGSLLRGNVDLTMPLPYYTENLGFVKKLDIPTGRVPLLQGRESILAVQFPEDPEPDYVDVDIDSLPYDE